jgi:dihydropyrimidinase/dihydroorotase
MMMPVMLAEGVNKGRLSLERVVQVVCENPAKTAGIWGRKGSLLPGFDADMVLIDLSREVKVGKQHINTRSGWSLMEGHTFKGWPVKTILRGKVTAEWADDGPGMRPVGEPRGKYLRRELGAARPGSMEVSSPVKISRTDRWLADPLMRPGFAPETLKYTKARGD